MKKHLAKGILGDQSGVETVEWIVIAAVIIIIIAVVFAIIRAGAVEKANEIFS
jgi:hypothetical protein